MRWIFQYGTFWADQSSVAMMNASHSGAQRRRGGNAMSQQHEALPEAYDDSDLYCLTCMDRTVRFIGETAHCARCGEVAYQSTGVAGWHYSRRAWLLQQRHPL